MKIYKIAILILSLLVVVNKLNADNKMHLGFSAGLAIPNEKMSQFFNDSRQNVQKDSISGIGRWLVEKATNVGYNLKIFGRIDLSDNFSFVPALGIVRFNDGIYDLIVPFGNDTFAAKTQTTTNIVPISLGINVHLFRKFLSPYFNGDLTYSYITYSYDVVWQDNFAVPIATSTTIHRLGYAIGAGIDIDLSLVSLNLEAKFHTINIIKYDDNEPTKLHFSFSLGIIF